MPSLTKPYETFEKPGLVLAYPLGAARLFKGGLVGLAPDGTPAPMNPATPMRFLGVSVENADPANGARRVTLAKNGSFVLRIVGPVLAATDVGRVVYAASDWEATVSPTGLANPVAIGTVSGLEPTAGGQPGVRVRIDLHTV